MTNKEIATEMQLRCLRGRPLPIPVHVSKLIFCMGCDGFITYHDDMIYITPKGEEEWARLDSLKHMKVHNGH